MRPRIIDLFCGAGGLSEGFRQAGFDVSAGSDIDPDACATYAHNFPEAAVFHGDLREGDVRGGVLEAAAGCDVVVGGPPCQAFSQVRNHTRIIDDPRNSLYREFVWIVRAVNPRFFVMENVPGLDQLGVREQIEEDLSINGRYRVTPQLVDAADFGVPQTRKRIIFAGSRSDLEVEPPRITGSGATSRFQLRRTEVGSQVRYSVESNRGVLIDNSYLEALEDPENLEMVSAEQAISDLISLTVGRRTDTIEYRKLAEPASAYQRLMRERASDVVSNVQVPRMNKDTELRLGAVPEGGNYRDLPESFRARYLTGEKWGPHNGSGRLDRKHYYAYRRLHHGLWAWTLNTKADSAYHYGVARALSVREFARLQSFPDRFSFTTDPRKGELPGRISGGAAHSRYRQVGNAVPPLLARQIAETVKAALEQVGLRGRSATA